MSGVQRAEVHWARYLDGNRRVVLEADHARIVAGVEARWVEIARQDRMAAHQRGAQEAERQHAKALADMEQAHAAALAAERERSYDLGYESGYEWGIADERAWVVGYLRDGKQMPSAEAQAWAHGFAEVIEQGSYNGAPAAAPSTLTADDPGYHSQRCLHCDHIRATHTLTAHGCIGHALPGRPGADCPCAEFIHDGEATPEVKPCSTCGEPVAYLTARPGWAGGWLHHPARPLDGHPAAIDGEATT